MSSPTPKPCSNSCSSSSSWNSRGLCRPCHQKLLQAHTEGIVQKVRANNLEMEAEAANKKMEQELKGEAETFVKEEEEPLKTLSKKMNLPRPFRLLQSSASLPGVHMSSPSPPPLARQLCSTSCRFSSSANRRSLCPCHLRFIQTVKKAKAMRLDMGMKATTKKMDQELELKEEPNKTKSSISEPEKTDRQRRPIRSFFPFCPSPESAPSPPLLQPSSSSPGGQMSFPKPKAWLQQPPAPKICRSNSCSFYSFNRSIGLCRPCYVKTIQAKAEAIKEVEAVRKRMEQQLKIKDKLQLKEEAEVVSKEEEPKKTRCLTCRAKVGLTSFACRCGGVYCPLHRYSDKHPCGFDYNALGRQEIARNNPVIRAPKLNRI